MDWAFNVFVRRQAQQHFIKQKKKVKHMSLCLLKICTFILTRINVSKRPILEQALEV